MFTKQEIKTHLLENYGFNNPLFGQKPNMNIVNKDPLDAIITYENGETLHIKSENSKHWKIAYSSNSQKEIFTTYATSLRKARYLLKEQINAVALPKYDDFQKSMQEKVDQTKKFEHLYKNVVNKCKSYKSDKCHIFNAEISISTPYHNVIEDKKEIVEEVFNQYLDILNEYVPEQKLYYKEYFDDKLIFKIQTNKKGTNFPIKKLINLSRLLKPQLENIDIHIRVAYWKIENKQNLNQNSEPFAKEFKKRVMSRCYYYGKYNPIIGFESTTHSNWLNRTLPIKDLETFKKELNLPELINLEDIQNFQKYLEDLYQNESAMKTLRPEQTKQFKKFIKKWRIFKKMCKYDQYAKVVFENAQKYKENQFIFTHEDFLQFINQSDFLKDLEKAINNRAKLNNFNHLNYQLSYLKREYEHLIDRKDFTIKKINSLYTVPTEIKEQLKKCKTTQEQIEFLIALHQENKLY